MSTALQAGVYLHPNGCGVADGGLVTLSQPGTLELGELASNKGLSLNSPAGGLEVRDLPKGVSIIVQKTSKDGDEDRKVVAVKDHDGCIDLPSLADTLWWSFCQTGKDCSEMSIQRSYPPPALSKREPIVSEVRAAAGHLHVPLPNAKRQDTTYTPPDDCYLDETTCRSLADSGALKAICVNCVQGYGDGFKASPEIDCTGSGTPCPITFTDTVTVTNTISADISFGGTIGDTGSDGGALTGSFSFGVSFSIATSHATAVGLSIPIDKKGYVDFAPQAVLGTVVTTTSDGNVCDAAGLNKICGAQPGKIITSDDDANGEYKVHQTG